MTEVRLENLTKIYAGEKMPAVDSISMTIEGGSLTALLGPSACGKSTILKMIAGLLSPTSGNILFSGKSILPLPPEKRDAVLMFQDHLMFPYMTVGENVAFGLKMRRRSKSDISQAVSEILELVQLPGVTDRKPSQLSGGQRQRVALARALILRPKILLLDEPFSNLDASLRYEMQDLLKALHSELGMTMLCVTHDQEEAVALADKIALVLNGQLYQYDTASILYSQPQDQKVAAFFGAENFIKGQQNSGYFDCPLGRLALPENTLPDGMILTFRPESVILNAINETENRFPATIRSCQFLGSQTRIRLAANGVTFDALLPPLAAEQLQERSEVTVHLPRAALWLLP